jgi:hypothetical protein
MVAIMDVSMESVRAVDEPDESGLVTEDDAPVDSILCEKEQRILTEPLYSSWAGPAPAGVGGEGGEPRPFAVLANVGLFSSLDEPPVVPDVMLSLDVKIPAELELKKNRSYFLWRYGKPPEVVIEIVSNRDGDELGKRFQRYRQIRVAYYVVYDPLHLLGDASIRTFELRGDLYVSVERPWFESVGLGLVEWEGVFEGTPGRWLRWCTRDGIVVPTGAERAQTSDLRAQALETRVQASDLRAQAAEARAARLAAQLRALGIDPNGSPKM